MKTPNVFAVASAIAARALIALALGAACTVTYAGTYQYNERGDLKTLTTPRGVRTYQYDEVQRLKLEQGYTGTASTSMTLTATAPPTGPPHRAPRPPLPMPK